MFNRGADAVSEHWLKAHTGYYLDVESGIKLFDVRIDDRKPPYKIGDILHLQEYTGNEYTGRECTRTITYVLRDNKYCKDGFCIIGLSSPELDRLRKENELLSYKISKFEESKIPLYVYNESNFGKCPNCNYEFNSELQNEYLELNSDSQNEYAKLYNLNPGRATYCINCGHALSFGHA